MWLRWPCCRRPAGATTSRDPSRAPAPKRRASPSARRWPMARGVIAGLGLAQTRDHVFRAILEGVACGVRHNVETLSQLGAHAERIVAVGGGAQTDTWLQIVSDVSGLRQEVPTVTLGACY